MDAGYRLDLLVEDLVIVELKAVETVSNLHKAQLGAGEKASDRRVRGRSPFASEEDTP